jgi:hypothetical protein
VLYCWQIFSAKKEVRMKGFALLLALILSAGAAIAQTRVDQMQAKAGNQTVKPGTLPPATAAPSAAAAPPALSTELEIQLLKAQRAVLSDQAQMRDAQMAYQRLYSQNADDARALDDLISTANKMVDPKYTLKADTLTYCLIGPACSPLSPTLGAAIPEQPPVARAKTK